MRSLPRIIPVVLLCVAALPLFGAASEALTVNVTFTIASSVDVDWSDNGATTADTAQTWAAGTLALSGTYVSDTDGVAPTLQYIKNNGSNAAVDISAVCGNSTSWSVGAAAGANTFQMEAKVGAGSYVSLESAQADIINNLASNGTSGKIVLRLKTPTSITVGGGLSQTVAVTFTATADNGD